MRKDELTLINFYCDNKNNILSQIEMNENKGIFNINAISDLKINIDKNSFDNMLISLNNLNFEINSFKGIDINNQFDNGKYIAQRNLYGMNLKNLDLNLSNDRIHENNFKINRKINTEMPRMNKSQNHKKTNSAKMRKKILKCKKNKYFNFK